MSGVTLIFYGRMWNYLRSLLSKLSLHDIRIYNNFYGWARNIKAWKVSWRYAVELQQFEAIDNVVETFCSCQLLGGRHRLRWRTHRVTQWSRTDSWRSKPELLGAWATVRHQQIRYSTSSRLRLYEVLRVRRQRSDREELRGSLSHQVRRVPKALRLEREDQVLELPGISCDQWKERS